MKFMMPASEGCSTFPVYFPYETMYKEQVEYMQHLRDALVTGKHALLEMPTGTGKTVTLLSLITSYQAYLQSKGQAPPKLVYCTRTVPEMEKVLEELKVVTKYRLDQQGKSEWDILALGLSSRKNMCVKDEVLGLGERVAVDAACRARTASWVRGSGDQSSGGAGSAAVVDIEDAGNSVCEYFAGFEQADQSSLLPMGVYTLQDLRDLGRSKTRPWCPYFGARYLIRHANIVVYNYAYILDPKISNMVSRELEKECVVVFDEAHNIDNVCIESMSVSINRRTLDGATRCLNRLRTELDTNMESSRTRLREEYERLMKGLATSGAWQRPTAGSGHAAAYNYLTDQARGAPLPISEEDLSQLIPADIRKAESFVRLMRLVVDTLKKDLLSVKTDVVQESAVQMLRTIVNGTHADERALKFAYDRLKSLMYTLQIVDVDEFTPLTIVADFVTIVATFHVKGFTLIKEPFDERLPGVYDPIIQLCCLDPSIAMSPVLKRFSSVVITSGTLSPIDLYPKILNMESYLSESFKMSMVGECICPMVVTRGSDQLALSSAFKDRQDNGVLRNYGLLLVEMAEVVPDGIVCFFTSYRFMEDVLQSWAKLDILDEIRKRKLVFVETQDVVETSLALDHYKKACDSGRGAVFLSIARGKVAEGIDFDRHYGRAVIVMGVPYQYTESRVLRARLQYMQEEHQVPEQTFLTFDALRQVSQCMGRVIRSKKDYGVMVFADKRFAREDKRDKLPKWIGDRIRSHPERMDMTVDSAVDKCRRFLASMAQPVDWADEVGRTLWAKEDVDAWLIHRKLPEKRRRIAFQ